MTAEYDLLIIGGGINGTGIARDAAGRGLKVLLVERDDLASATSSRSTKLIHGGLRYLEYYEFLLVRKALTEREILLKAAPHIIHPMKFILPHEKHLRPKWLIRLGLFLYDHLGMRKTLGRSRQIAINATESGNPLKDHFTDGFTYYDCTVDDARLVVLTALDARDQGAEILTRTTFLTAQNKGDHWQAQLSGGRQVTARVMINAAGPWVSDIIDDGLSLPAHNRLRLIKGSHIIVPKLFDGEAAYILQNGDGRIIFAIPYEDDFTLIGTTDVAFDGDPAQVTISTAEIDYLCQHINQYFKPTLPHGQPLSASDVVSHYAGVRPLYDDATQEASAVTRDYVLALREDAGAPLLSVFGGKITTYRHLAEKALERLAEFFPTMADPWTGQARLPGGDIDDWDQFLLEQKASYPELEPALCARYARLYGRRMEQMLTTRRDDTKLIGPGLYDYEVEFLIRTEWARTAEDILWRRTKLGLTWSDTDVAQLEKWLTEHR
ncbi:MAG: glycerol-3-phosphate dehydrogenase [Alphaproteobacteria bacterium]|nr:MAG: glycerol-3-phosphate dehydrogenase [Alphaproteobacteria bacterium]